MKFPWRPSKTVVWGCGLHQHTNSYVYAAFHKAFRAMGFESYWLDSSHDVSGMDFSNSLFLTEGQHDAGIPLRDDCKYVLHNCSSPKYMDLPERNRLVLQVFTNDVLKRDVEPMGDGAYYYRPRGGCHCLFQPWATDLLPEEIDPSWTDLPREKIIHWVGTIGHDQFGNDKQITPFVKEALGAGIEFRHHGPGSCDFDMNKRLIQQSIVAPAIVGTWQAENGYIPCRIFKNISYGHMGVTNSKATHDLFYGRLVFNEDTAALFHQAMAVREDRATAREFQNVVRQKHTYVNRISNILSVI